MWIRRVAIFWSMPTALTLILTGSDDFLIDTSIEMGDTAAVGDDLAQIAAVAIRSEHAGLQMVFLHGASQEEKTGVAFVEHSVIAPQVTIFQFRMPVLDEFIKIEHRNRQGAFAGLHIHNKDAVVVRMRDIFGRIFDSLVADGFTETSQAAIGQAQGVFAVVTQAVDSSRQDSFLTGLNVHYD